MSGDRFRLETEQAKLDTACSGDILRRIIVEWPLTVACRATPPTFLLAFSCSRAYGMSATSTKKDSNWLLLHTHTRVPKRLLALNCQDLGTNRWRLEAQN